MKRALICSLSLALLLSLAACHKPQAEQQATSQPDPAATSTLADVSTPEPEKPADPEPEPEQTPVAPVENEETQEPAAAPEPQKITVPEPPAEQTPLASVEPEETQPAEEAQQTQQPSTSDSAQKIDGHDDLGDYILNGKGGKYYPALGVTLPVSYDGKTSQQREDPNWTAVNPEHNIGETQTAEQHTEAWQGVSVGG